MKSIPVGMMEDWQKKPSIPTQAVVEYELLPPPLGSLGVGTVNVPVTERNVPYEVHTP